MTQPVVIEGASHSLLFLCDHASAAVPADIDLRIDPALLRKHIAVDLGAEPLARALASLFDAPAILGTVSRLVIDLHREPDHPALIPAASDGYLIPGNENADRGERIARFFAPYHHMIARRVRCQRPGLIVAVHSFTPALESDGIRRPWEVGLLYNRDDRAARIALAALAADGVAVGDNQPYSGRLLNMTLNRHAEANGIPYLGIEVRNDLIADGPGVARWAGILASAIRRTLAACGRPPARL